MSLTMRHQLDDMQALHNRMNRLFEGAGRGQKTGARDGEGSAGNAPRLWALVVDVVESETEIVLHAELPGMRRDDIDIQLHGDTLTLRAERQLQSAGRGENFHRIERQYGAFQRTFGIETPIDASTVSASYKDGVLTVRLPKQHRQKPRQIEIQVK